MLALAAGDISLASLLEKATFPVIARPFDTHAGQGMEKINASGDLLPFLSGHNDLEFYLTQFVDYRSLDEKFRKQRLVFIDGKAYASHMAVSDHWMVHYLNAEMEQRPERRTEEAIWMHKFDEDFGKRHAAALDSLHRRIGLDYFVIDCAELQDGRLLLFEADVAMIVHAMDSEQMFPYKRPAMEKIFQAFSRAMTQRVQQSRGETDVTCAHSGQPAIFQRTESDCLVCCLAMLRGCSYEHVELLALQCDRTYPIGGPMSHSIMRGVAEKLGIALFSSIYMYWAKPAIIGVISPTKINTGHATFWDGQKIIDPAGCQNVDRSYVDRSGIEFIQTADAVTAMLALPQMQLYIAPVSTREEAPLLG